MRTVALLLAVFLLAAHQGHTQNAATDTTTLLDFDTFMELVRGNHPVAQQANLQPEKGLASVMEARGGFDPKTAFSIGQKYFDDKDYYSLINGGLKIPTRLGVEVQAGYDQNEGLFLNPENNLPAPGLWHAGIALPLGEGLFTDARRIALRQAKIYQQSTEVDRQIIYNDLLLAAGIAYWDWFMAYNQVLIYQDALNAAQIRYEGVKISAGLGDVPYIDTLEAGIQVQSRLLGLQQAQLDQANATALLSTFLWTPQQTPLEVVPGTVPTEFTLMAPTPADSRIRIQRDSMLAVHPTLQQVQFKLQGMDADRAWQVEQLKPTVNLKYNAITEPVGGDVLAQYSVNNYTWGLQFGMPLFVRKERGKLRLTNLKIQETRFEANAKMASVGFKVDASLNEWATTNDQATLFTRTVQDYLGLLEGERALFRQGESSLFLVNRRELGYISAQVKLVELLAKNRKAILKTYYSLGKL